MKENIWDSLRQGVIVILISAAVSLVPFYFQTSAMTNENHQASITQQQELNETIRRIQNLELKGAIDDTEIKQIKESLQRIEKKIDRLIESEK